MPTVYLGLGSNLGNSITQLKSALSELNALESTQITARSRLYCSKPWGKPDQPDFVNMVAQAETTLTPESLLHECKRIEREAGRTAGERWGPRVLDIDILLYEGVIRGTPELAIPHPRMWERRFVLQPLADLWPNLTAPQGTGIGELLKRDNISSQGVWLCGEVEGSDENAVW